MCGWGPYAREATCVGGMVLVQCGRGLGRTGDDLQRAGPLPQPPDP